MPSKEKIVKIGNSSGFWGDEPLALQQQLSGGALSGNQLDYVVADYLAEVSMSILSKQQAKTPDLGYVADFIDHLTLAKDYLHLSTKIVTNAGGNNPIACAKKLASLFKEWKINKRIFAVVGDNIFLNINQLLENGENFINLETSQDFSAIQPKTVAANTYTDASGIAKALELGADIVITGRASDSALVIGPLQFEFGWKSTDYDLIAAGMTAGHILECGAQATGGNFTDWQQVADFEQIGFPIVEMKANGEFIVTKHLLTGGLVSVNTVKEQLVYEINDPKKYYGPDVIADFTSLNIYQLEKNRVKVTGCKGYCPPNTWKVSMAYQNGYKAVGGLVLSQPNAKEKAELVAQLFWSKLPKFKKIATQFIGLNACHGDMGAIESSEILVQFVAFDDNKALLDLFSKQIAAMILTGPQGLAALGGRPKIQEVVSYWPTLVEKTNIKLLVFEIDKDTLAEKQVAELVSQKMNDQTNDKLEEISPNQTSSDFSIDNPIKVKLLSLCLARSGDKGNTVNIGVIARSVEIYDFLKIHLNEKMVKKAFKSMVKGKVTRYELPNLLAFNFVLTEALDGGGTYSGRIDPQGKTFGSALLNLEIEIPKKLLQTIKK